MSSIFELAIIGMGPAGIGVAMAIRDSSLINNTICFERGAEIGSKNCTAVNNNSCCESDACHIISGIGGASNLSSGKMSYFPAGSGLVPFFKDEHELKLLMEQLIENFEDHIGLKKVEIDPLTIMKEEERYKSNNIIFKYYDVYEFDGEKYRNYLSDSVTKLISNGLQVHTNSEIVSIKYTDEMSCYSITAKENGVINSYCVKKIVFAVGASEIEQCILSEYTDKLKTSYEIGVRVEARSECFGNSLNSHGDLKLKYNEGRTYCVTIGGHVVSYRTNGYYLLEGYTDLGRKTDYSNLAILIKTNKKADFEEFLQKCQSDLNGIPIRQKYTDYQLNQMSHDSVYTTLPKSQLGDINNLFSNSVNKEIKEFINHVIINSMGINGEELTIIAPELKIAQSLKISRQFEIAKNLYVIGAATGKFRGILQSFCSGIQCGKYFLRR